MLNLEFEKIENLANISRNIFNDDMENRFTEEKQKEVVDFCMSNVRNIKKFRSFFKKDFKSTELLEFNNFKKKFERMGWLFDSLKSLYKDFMPER